MKALFETDDSTHRIITHLDNETGELNLQVEEESGDYTILRLNKSETVEFAKHIYTLIATYEEEQRTRTNWISRLL